VREGLEHPRDNLLYFRFVLLHLPLKWADFLWTLKLLDFLRNYGSEQSKPLYFAVKPQFHKRPTVVYLAFLDKLRAGEGST
jgi:hypothetical protein